MDFPISVPSVGLVGGKFVDEDAVAGTPGSLIPAQWGNAVTEEILNVIEAAGLSPDEDDNAQLLAALNSIVGTNVPQATEVTAGRAKVATQIQVTTGTDDATMVTPKKMAERLSAGGPVVGTTANLKMTLAAASTSATITADEVVVKSSLAGRTWTLGGFNKTLNIANVGALGMDIGPAPTNGWLAIYAGLNEATGATTVFAQSVGNSLAAATYVGGVGPAGITATALLTVVPTNGSGQIKVCAVKGRKIYIQLMTVYSGNVSVTNIPVSIAGIVPVNAKEVSGELTVGNSALSTMSLTIHPDLSIVGQQSMTTTVGAGQALTLNYTGLPISIDQQLMFTSSSTAGTPTFNIYIASYSI